MVRPDPDRNRPGIVITAFSKEKTGFRGEGRQPEKRQVIGSEDIAESRDMKKDGSVDRDRVAVEESARKLDLPLPRDLLSALAGELTPKFLATLDGVGTPNVVPVISVEAADDRTLRFGDFMLWKTRRNLETNPTVTVCVVTETLRSWTIRGRFLGFQRKGEHFERLNERPMFRYNAYTGIRAAGTIRVEGVFPGRCLSKPVLLSGFLLTRLARSWTPPSRLPGGMPREVSEKYGRLKAVKVLSYEDEDGYPHSFPVLTLQPAGDRMLVFAPGEVRREIERLVAPRKVAAAVITFDPVAYQVKGIYRGVERWKGRRVGIVDIGEIYSASPPLPGEQIA
jgi:predicted pyridoxine 5'-phosphate oxidase superfamily flavin-nucleotide-binding protein